MATQGPFDTVAQPAELVQPPREGRTRERRRLSESTVIGFVAVVIFFIVWQGVGFVRTAWPDGVFVGPFKFVAPSQLFLPAPTDVFTAFQAYIQDGRIWKDMAVSGQELAIGYLAAAILGILLGLHEFRLPAMLIDGQRVNQRRPAGN